MHSEAYYQQTVHYYALKHEPVNVVSLLTDIKQTTLLRQFVLITYIMGTYHYFTEYNVIGSV